MATALTPEGVKGLRDMDFEGDFWHAMGSLIIMERRVRYCSDMMVSGRTYFAVLFSLSTYKMLRYQATHPLGIPGAANGIACQGMLWHAMACHGLPWHDDGSMYPWIDGMPWHATACHGSPQLALAVKTHIICTIWNSPADPADLPDPAKVVAASAPQTLPSTCAGGQDDVS